MLKKTAIVIIAIFTFLIVQNKTSAQSGNSFSDFSKKLEFYFHPDLVSDIAKEMEATDVTVWGWDVGDFSGDGNNDVAFAVRKLRSNDRKMTIYLFVDIDGFLVKVEQFQHEFVELPLEVGVAIRYGVVYVTEKYKQYNWKIDGYRFVHGSLIKVDNFVTQRKGKLTNEVNKNYETLRSSEKFIVTTTGKTEFLADYLTIPSYSRFRMLYRGITDTAFSNYIEYCPQGAYWWSGDDDLSFSVSSSYDKEFLYFTINIKDDTVSMPYRSIENGERVNIYIDATNYPDTKSRFATDKNDLIFYNSKPTSNMYKISILAGDFVDKAPEMTLQFLNENASMFTEMNEYVVTDLTDNGYYVMFKIPFAHLGYSEAPISDSITYWGLTVSVNDIDNEFRPKQRTILQTSIFDEKNPATYGSLAFIPDAQWYGTANNIFKTQIMNALEKFGF